MRKIEFITTGSFHRIQTLWTLGGINPMSHLAEKMIAKLTFGRNWKITIEVVK